LREFNLQVLGCRVSGVGVDKAVLPEEAFLVCRRAPFLIDRLVFLIVSYTKNGGK
jgi:hypothetical protein